jgi:hypothetical protein
MGWMVWESNDGGIEIFHTHPDRPRGTTSLLCKGNWVYFPQVKWLGHGVDHMTHLAPSLKKE